MIRDKQNLQVQSLKARSPTVIKIGDLGQIVALPDSLVHFRRLESVPKSDFSRSGLKPGVVRAIRGGREDRKWRFLYHVRQCGLPAGDRASVVFALHANPSIQVHLKKVDGE